MRDFMNAAASTHGVVLVCTIPHLRCRSVTSLTCCTRLAENTGRKISLKIRHLRTIAQLCWTIGLSSQQSEKKLLNSNISHTCPHNMVNFGPLVAEIGSLVWGTPANFNGFRVLMVSLLQRRRSTESHQTSHDLFVWPSPELVHYIFVHSP